MRSIVMFCAIIALVGSLWNPTTARSQGVPVFIENHYKVYEVPESFSIPVAVLLDDQWGSSQHSLVVLDKFANPVDKNGEGIPDSTLHQTWWSINDPQPGRQVEIDNQFGRQSWFVKDGRYLVLPAFKNIASSQPPDQNAANHYKCYDAQGPALAVPVVLRDQFGVMSGKATFPRYFCNPVRKSIPGQTFPAVNDSLHLACYQIDPVENVQFPLFAIDQFGGWSLTAIQTEWLCVPTQKLQFVPIESETWGHIKKMYR